MFWGYSWLCRYPGTLVIPEFPCRNTRRMKRSDKSTVDAQRWKSLKPDKYLCTAKRASFLSRNSTCHTAPKGKINPVHLGPRGPFGTRGKILWNLGNLDRKQKTPPAAAL